jgi:hypothetical protein
MAVLLNCPFCALRVQVPDDAMDNQVRCPGCKQVFLPRSPQATGPVVPPESWPASEGIQENAPELPGASTASRERIQNVPDRFPPPWHWERSDMEDEEYPAYIRLRRPLAGLGRAKAAEALLIVSMIFSGVVLVVDVIYVQEIDRIMVGLGNDRRVARIEAIRAVLAFLELGVQIGTAVVFLMWIYSAHANLTLLRVEGQQYSPGWAVGYFFIPFLNLIRPYQVVQEIWKGSDPETSSLSESAWKARPGNSLAPLWWLSWLIYNFTAYISFRILMNPTLSIQDHKIGVVLAAVSQGATIIAAPLILSIIRGIARRQTVKHSRLVEAAQDY